MKLQPGKLLRLYISEGDEHEGRPLYEAIVARCQDMNVAGFTVFRGLEGFGHSAQIHRPHLFAQDQPVVITIIEKPEKTREIVAALQQMAPAARIAVTDVECMPILDSKPFRL